MQTAEQMRMMDMNNQNKTKEWLSESHPDIAGTLDLGLQSTAKAFSNAARRVAPGRSEHIAKFHRWANGPMAVNKPNTSLWYKCVADMHAGKVFIGDRPILRNYTPDFFHGRPQIFLMEHDWAGAIGAGVGDYAEVLLPFDCCCFEWELSGRRVLALVEQPCGGGGLSALVLVRDENAGWFPVGVTEGVVGEDGHDVDSGENAAYAFIFKSIKALCIALEAEVAATTVVQAPTQLNKARAKAGRVQLNDYHTVNVTHRGNKGGDKKKQARQGNVRLHFRRGHMRYWSDGRSSWVRWCLVGNPDLGFIDKHYRA